MNISNKLLLSIIAFSLALTAIGVSGLLIYDSNLADLVDIGITLFLISGTYLLIKNGTFVHSPEFRISRLGISIIIIGVLCKIMHWPFAAGILTFGYLIFPVIYLYYLIKHNRFRWTDFFKILFISAISLSIFLKLFHMLYSAEVQIIGIMFLLILVIDLIKTKKIYLDIK